MCGIAGIHYRQEKLPKLNTEAILATMLEEIAHRGGDATGYLAMSDEGVTEWQKAACDVKDFNWYRRPVPRKTRTVLAHTRWATQGLAAFMENNHPLRRGTFYVIHNGHVNNDDELFKMSGRKPFGQVDTEAIAAYIAFQGELGKVGKAMEEIDGAAAIAVVDERKPRSLVLARGYSSPLNVLVTDKLVMWGSTESTIRRAYKQHVGRLPKRQKIESLPEGVMLLIEDGKITRSKFEPYAPAPYVWTGRPGAWRSEVGEAACSVSDTKRLGKWDPILGYDDPEQDEIDAEMTWSAEDILDKPDKYTIECDECGGETPWSQIIKVAEPDSDFEWKLCEDCCDLWNRLDDEEYDKANRASGGGQ